MRRHLHHESQLFVEQERDGIGGVARKIDLESAVSGKRHLQQRRDQAAVAPIVARRYLALANQALHDFERSLELRWVAEIGRVVSQLFEHVRQGGSTQPREAVREIRVENPSGLAAFQVRGDHLRHVRTRHVRRDDQSARGLHRLVLVLVVLARSQGRHGQAVLAAVDRDAELQKAGAEGGRRHGEIRSLTGQLGGPHPVS